MEIKAVSGTLGKADVDLSVEDEKGHFYINAENRDRIINHAQHIYQGEINLDLTSAK
jgi:hypothetical protein